MKLSSADTASKPQQGLPIGFCGMLWRLLVLLRPLPALFLVALSFLEAILVFKVGQVAGQYYLIIVDQQHSLFIRTTLISAALYACNTIVKSTSLWLSELLAYSWRGTLTRTLQQHYCQKEHFFWLSTHNDNPDQRITQDANIFCNSLGSITRVVAAAPFQVVYYTYWTYRFTSGYVVLAVYIFFLASLLIESVIIRPIARVVFRQERMEGNFRFAHMRLRTFLTELALYRAGAAEKAALDAALTPVLCNQLRLLMWRWLLTACTTGLEYTGALLNYTCIGLVVFTGCLPVDMDSGEVAKWVSNASFATLTLIYSFTQLLDLASQMSTLVGVTLRVGQLLQELETLQEASTAAAPHHAKAGIPSPNEHTPLLGVTTHEDLTANALQHRPQQPAPARQLPKSSPQHNSHPTRPQSDQLRPPLHSQPQHQTELLVEVQPHDAAGGLHAYAVSRAQQWQPAVSASCGRQDAESASHGRQDAVSASHGRQDAVSASHGRQDAESASHGRQDAVSASQQRQPGASVPGPRQHSGSMPQQGQSALGQPSMRPLQQPSLAAGTAQVGAGGHHCDVLEGSSHEGAALAHGSRGGDCSGGTGDGSGGGGSGTGGGSSGTGGGGSCAAVAAVHGLSCERPDGKLLFQDVSFQVHPGEMVLVAGPSGCGKSSLVQALAGLWPLCQGQTSLPMQQQVQISPQRPVAAPGGSLMEQVIYPSPLPGALADVDTHLLAHLLHQVGLAELLQRAQGDWTMSQDWQGMLSPGELQKLSFARVLFHRPMLAVMDEPVSAVGSQAGIDLLQLLQQSGIAAIITGQIDSALADQTLGVHLFCDIVRLQQ